MTPHKPAPQPSRSWADLLSMLVPKSDLLKAAVVVIVGVAFVPEAKQIFTNYTGIHLSQEAVVSTEIMQKLDAQKNALDSTSRIGYRARNIRMDSTLTHISLVMDTMADMMRYTPTGKKMNGEYKQLLKRRWELDESIGFNPHRTEEVK